MKTSHEARIIELKDDTYSLCDIQFDETNKDIFGMDDVFDFSYFENIESLKDALSYLQEAFRKPTIKIDNCVLDADEVWEALKKEKALQAAVSTDIKPGDEVYVINDNSIEKIEIDRIETIQTRAGVKVRYIWNARSGINSCASPERTFDIVFKTPDEACEYLKANMKQVC